MDILRIAFRIAVSVILGGLAGCGGDSGGGTTSTAPPPPALASGQIDTSYGIQGRAEIAQGKGGSMGVAADGSVYVWNGAQARKLDPNGSPVGSYGESGVVGMDPQGLSSAVIDEEGNLYFTLPSGIAKVSRDGRPDIAFGSGGRTSLPFESLGVYSWRLTRDRAGNLYVLGSGTSATYAAKFDPQGQLASGYGDGTGLGTVSLHPASTGMWIVDSSGAAYVAESLNDPGANALRLVVARLDNKAALSTEFAVGGFWTSGNCNLASGASLAVAADGNVTGVATCMDSTSYYPELFKLDARGNPVDTFHSGARPGLLQGAPSEIASTLAFSARGELYVGGQRATASQCADAVVTKLDRDGNGVAAFGVGGRLSLPSGPERNWVSALGIDAAGRVYVGVMAGSCLPFSHTPAAFHIYRVGG